MYSLIIIFIFIPLYFSHFFAQLGFIIGENSSFERQKVYLFFILVLFACIELIWSHYNQMIRMCRRYGIYSILFVAFPLFVTVFWRSTIDTGFFFGSYEKHHGYLFFVFLTVLWLLLTMLTTREKHILVRASLVSGVFVSFFALLETLEVPIFFQSHGGGSWGTGRSISTLGNPNYVAGYLLILIPLAVYMKNRFFYVLVILFGMAIIATKSFIAIFLLVLYGFWKWASCYKFIRCTGCVVFIIGILLLIFGYELLSPDKLLSLISRLVLMQETLRHMLYHPLSFIGGFGPDTIIQSYFDYRSESIRAYFPEKSAIDSSHNIFIDFTFQYGMIPLLYLVYCFAGIWKKLQNMSKEGLILGFAFLSLNPYVLVHCIMLIFLTSLHASNA